MLQEKQYNLLINVWIRAPALVSTALLARIQVHLQSGVAPWMFTIRVLLMILAVWNGLFFMERVVGNYHVCAYKAKREQQILNGQQSNSFSDYDETYTTDEHLSGILPGFSGPHIRTSVSTQDLDQLHHGLNGKKVQ